MSFTSFIFPIFLLIVVVLYYLLPESGNKWLLLVASWFFYAYNNLKVFLLLPTTTLLTFFSALGMERSKKQSAKKAIFIVTIVICFVVLFAFKYLGFFADTAISLARLFNAQVDNIALNIILPIGISFYTFQTVSYIIDVYFGKVSAEHDFCYYAVFVSFFPQLVAGPIERYGDLMSQLKQKSKFDTDNLRMGIAMILCGLIKKVVVADTLAIAVNAVFNAGDLSQLTALSVFVASALFFVQIYCDFSGYSDIAIGCARLLGIKLTKNFDRPFLATSVTEFWSRWHITLSGWFGEYVYLPLAFKTRRKKHKMFYRCLITLTVMLLCGLWHGADWSFVLWGAMLGVMQIIEILLRKPAAKFCADKNINPNGKLLVILRRIGTMLAIIFTMTIFRANSFSDAMTLYGRMFVGWDAQNVFAALLSQTSITLPFAAIAILGIAIMSGADRFIAADGGKIATGKRGIAFCFVAIAAVWCILFAIALQIANGQINSFIYFQF